VRLKCLSAAYEGIETGVWLVFEPGKEGIEYDLYRKLRGTDTR